MQNIAVFASGTGTNFQALANAFQRESWQEGRIGLVFSDNPNAPVIQRASEMGIPTATASVQDFSSKTEFEEHVRAILKGRSIRFLVLAGYMRLLGSSLLEPYRGRIINIHPSLLPAFPGRDAVDQALSYGVRVTGVTVHYVDDGMDTGPIIYQEALCIGEGETKDSLEARIHAIEHRIYPRIVRACIEGKVTLVGDRVVWKEEIV